MRDFEAHSNDTLNRRELLSALGLVLVAPALLGAGADGSAGPVIAVTANGRLRGLRDNGVVSFKGIPYAADTGGRNRFMAPRPAANWSGIREAFHFGTQAPQTPYPWASQAEPKPVYGEDCCVLNVFTPDLNRNARRPVMFWVHGGGFVGGSGKVDASNLAKFGDVVVVAANHRLNVFGYTHLGFVDPDFADSANAGQLDLIAALGWVKTNIAAFGGDPHNVTVFGQSGGGSKITTLQLMPKANGLFQKAINMSGSSGFNLKLPADEERVTMELLKVLGLGRGELRKLQDTPAAQLAAASQKAIANAQGETARPMVDGRLVMYQPLSPEGLAMHAAMPTILSATSTEAGFILGFDKRNFQVTADQVLARIASQYQLDEARAREVMAGYTQDDPQRTPWEVLLAAASEAWVRAAMHRGIEANAGLRRAPVYLLDFNYKVDPVLGAVHAADIPYAFGNQVSGDNTYDQFNPDTRPAGATVAANTMSTFVAFARTGNPNNPRIPAWPTYDLGRRATLVMDEQPSVVDDFRGADRRTSESLPAQDPGSASRGALFRYA